jgi:glycerol kinase
METCILSIDQGTTSTRALVYDRAGTCRGSGTRDVTQFYPRPGLVEHDAAQIWRTVAEVVPAALSAARVTPRQVEAIGLTNQRETVVVWERQSSGPVAPALVWQDRRTADFCRQRKDKEDWLRQKTGLVLDPYFSATKLHWLLEHVDGLRGRAERSELLAGTIDSWLIWNLTGGQTHVTDGSNASRTLLYNLHEGRWDESLLDFFGVPAALLPRVQPSASLFGTTLGLGFLPDGIPITGVAGDQQAALFGQGGFDAGAAKCTYGTGAFFLQHTGEKPVLSRHQLLASMAATTSAQPQYVLEGSVFVAGAAVQWLRDGMGLIATAAEVEGLAARSDPRLPVLFVPALVGLGAPHWAPEARGVIFGLTRDTTAADLARAALEGVALEVADLIDAAAADTGHRLASLAVDGGMARNNWFLQTQANLLGIPVVAAAQSEATALGAAFLAGLPSGYWPDLDALRKLSSAGQRFEPALEASEREGRRKEWRRAVQAVIEFYR